MATYSVQNDIIYEESEIELAPYKIINSFIESEFVFYDSSAVPHINVDNVQEAIDELYARRVKAGTAIKIDDDNVIHGDYKAGIGIKIIKDPVTHEYDIIAGDYVGGIGISIDGNVISLTYQAGTAIKIFDNTINMDYKEGIGIRIYKDIITGNYKPGNAVTIRENTFIGNYQSGNAIYIDGDVIHGNYQGGNAIDIHHDIINGDYKAGTAIRIENDIIYGDYKGGNAIIVDNNFIHGDYKGGVGIRVEGDIIHGNYVGGVGIRIVDDVIHGDYKGGIAIEVDDDVISATYEAGVGVSIFGNVIRGNYKPGVGIDILDDIILCDYKGGVAVKIVGETISGDYIGGNAINITGNVITGDYHGGNAIQIEGDIIRGMYLGGTGVRINGDIISGAYKGGTAIDITGNVISGAYKSGNAIDINGDVINSCYKAGIGIKIDGEIISGDYMAMSGVAIYGDIVYGDYKGGIGVKVYDDVIEGDYKGGNAIIISGNRIIGDYKAGTAIKIKDEAFLTINQWYMDHLGRPGEITGLQFYADIYETSVTDAYDAFIAGCDMEHAHGQTIKIMSSVCDVDFYSVKRDGTNDINDCEQTLNDITDDTGRVIGKSIPGDIYKEDGMVITNQELLLYTDSAIISGDYKGGNAVTVTEDEIIGSYLAGDNIDITGDVISATYVGGTGINITDNIISGAYTGADGVVVEGNVIRGDYLGGGCEIAEEAACLEPIHDVLSGEIEICDEIVQEIESNDGTVLLGHGTDGTLYYENGSTLVRNFVIDTVDPTAQIIYDWYIKDLGRSPGADGLRYWFDEINAHGQFDTYKEFYMSALDERQNGRAISIITAECEVNLYTVAPDGTNNNIKCVPPGICGCAGTPTVTNIDNSIIESSTAPTVAFHGTTIGTFTTTTPVDWASSALYMFTPSFISYPIAEADHVLADYYDETQYLKAIAKHWSYNNSQNNSTWTSAQALATILANGHPDAYSHFSEWGWKAGVNPSDRFDVQSYIARKAQHVNDIAYLGGQHWTVFSTIRLMEDHGLNPLTHLFAHGIDEGIPAYGVPPYQRADDPILLGEPSDITQPLFVEEEYLQFQARYANRIAYEGRTDYDAESTKQAIWDAHGYTPYEHFRTHGWLNGIHPSNNFDIVAYCRKRIAIENKTIAETSGDPTTARYGMYNFQKALIDANYDPLQHYIKHGADESAAHGIPVAYKVHPIYQVVPAEMGGDHSIGCPTAAGPALEAADVTGEGGVLLAKAVQATRYRAIGDTWTGKYIIHAIHPIAQEITYWYKMDLGRPPEEEGLIYWFNIYLEHGPIYTYNEFYTGVLLELEEAGQTISIITDECGVNLYKVNVDGTHDGVECVPPGKCKCDGEPTVTVVNPTDVTTPPTMQHPDILPGAGATWSAGTPDMWAGSLVHMNSTRFMASPNDKTTGLYNEAMYLRYIARHWSYNNSQNNMAWTPTQAATAIFDTGSATVKEHFDNWGWKANAHPSDEFHLTSYITQLAYHFSNIVYLGGDQWTEFHVIRWLEDNNTNPLQHFLDEGAAMGLKAFNVPVYERHNQPILLGPPIDESKPFFIEEEYLQFHARNRFSPVLTPGEEPRTSLEVKNNMLALGYTPYQHFRAWGWQRGTNPSNNFDVHAYVRKRIAIQNALITDGSSAEDARYGMYNMQDAFIADNYDPIQHYILWGKDESATWGIPAAFQVHPIHKVIPAEMGGDGSIGCGEGEGNGFTEHCIPEGCGISIAGNTISLNKTSLDVYSAGNGIKIDADNTIHGNYYAGTRIKIEEDKISMDLVPGPGLLVCDGEISIDPSIIDCCLTEDAPAEVLFAMTCYDCMDPCADPCECGLEPPDPPLNSSYTIKITLILDGVHAGIVETNMIEENTGKFYSDLGSMDYVAYLALMGSTDPENTPITDLSGRIDILCHKNIKWIDLPSDWLAHINDENALDVTVYAFHTYTDFGTIEGAETFLQQYLGFQTVDWLAHSSIAWADITAGGWHEMVKIFPDVADVLFDNLESTPVILAFYSQPPVDGGYTFGHIMMPNATSDAFTISYNSFKTADQVVNEDFTELFDVGYIVGLTPLYTTYHEFGHFLHYCNTPLSTWNHYTADYGNGWGNYYKYDFSEYDIPAVYIDAYNPPPDDHIEEHAYAHFIHETMSHYSATSFPVEYGAEVFCATLLSSKTDTPEIQTCMEIYVDFHGWISKYFCGFE